MISSQKIVDILGECLLSESQVENTDNNIKPIHVDGITYNLKLHPEKVSEYSEDISKIINELPEEFKNGSSFLKLCHTKDGEKWTSLHRICEALMILGVATNKMKYCFPKEIWSKLPEGVPYIRIV